MLRTNDNGVRPFAAVLTALTLATAIACAASTASAQDAPAAGDEQPQWTLPQLWAEMISYCQRAKGELAASFARKILEGEYSPLEIYRASLEVENSPAILRRAAGLEEMRPHVDALLERLEAGFAAEAVSPARIAAEIDALGGSIGEYRGARRRLTELSGEFALPQLLARLRTTEDEMLKQRIVSLLPEFGLAGVRPLSAALQTDSPELQKVLAVALGRIGYPHAAPRLKQLLGRELVGDVRSAARTALVACAGESALAKSAADLFYQNGLKYYYREDSILPDARFDFANVWYYDDQAGLRRVEVPREIFCDVYAMRMAREALASDASFSPAIPLWLSAIVNKGANLPEGASDPTWAQGLRGAEFYLLAAGARYQQDVLQRALADENAPVAIAAIEALHRTSGARSLVEPIADGAQPLVAALQFPRRDVRIRAALALAGANPHEPFEGDDQVLYVLNQAFRLGSQRYALLLSDETTTGNAAKAALREAGFTVEHHTAAEAALAAARALPGVDLLVLADVAVPQTLLRQLRSRPTLSQVSAAVVTANPGGLAERFAALSVVDAAEDTAAMAEAFEAATRLDPDGPLDTAQAADFAIQASGTVRTLALTDRGVFDVLRALDPLVGVLGDERSEVLLAAAGALAAIDEPRAQRALAERALGDVEMDPAVRMELLERTTESVRRFGTCLSGLQTRAVLAVVRGDGPAELRDAAAQLLGSLDLPASEIESLVVETGR